MRNQLRKLPLAVGEPFVGLLTSRSVRRTKDQLCGVCTSSNILVSLYPPVYKNIICQEEETPSRQNAFRSEIPTFLLHTVAMDEENPPDKTFSHQEEITQQYTLSFLYKPGTV